MSNFTCPTCGLTNIDCGKAGYKTAREIELEKKLEIAVKAIDKVLNDDFIMEHANRGLLRYLLASRASIKGDGTMKLKEYLIKAGINFEEKDGAITVGGSLNLSGTGITSLPDNLTVGGWLDLSNTGITSKEREKVKKPDKQKMFEFNLSVQAKLSWQNGRYRIFDGIFCEVLRKLKNAYKVKIELATKYVVTDGVNYAHGDTIKEARADLMYKISDRDTSQYEDLSLDSVVTKEDAIKMYRAITGACEAGTKHFVGGLRELKPRYTIAEIIELTEGQFGATDFKNFFKGDSDDKI